MMIGVLGGGQLGRMLALAGYPLGLRFRFLESAAEAPSAVLAETIQADYLDRDALARFASGLDLATYEFENVPEGALSFLESRVVPVFPPPRALRTAQDRLLEKTFFQDLGIPTSPFAPVSSEPELTEALKHIGLPAVLKTRRFGYDGKGQAVLRHFPDAKDALASLGGENLLLEGFVPFEWEVSILAVRGKTGATAFYPLVENYHKDGILRLSRVPATGVTPGLRELAESYAERVLAELQYVGVLAIEFFLVKGQLLANEMAPRVHNTGHWTIEGAETSQFENHLRAGMGLPLGGTAAVGSSAMINLIGTLPPLDALLAIPGAHPHLYGKSPRPGRKLGHVTLWSQDLQVFDSGLEKLRRLVGW